MVDAAGGHREETDGFSFLNVFSGRLVPWWVGVGVRACMHIMYYLRRSKTPLLWNSHVWSMSDIGVSLIWYLRYNGTWLKSSGPMKMMKKNKENKEKLLEPLIKTHHSHTTTNVGIEE